MSDTNAAVQSEAAAPEEAKLKLDVRVRPITPVGNLLAFASVTINDCFKVENFRICSSEKGLYVNMPSTQDKSGNWRDICWPVTSDFRSQLTGALLDGYSAAIESLRATLDASCGAAERPSVTDSLKDKGKEVKSKPSRASGKQEPSR